MTGLRRWFLSYAAIVLGVSLASHVEADVINIVNAGFESPVLSDGDYTFNNVPGWTLTIPNAWSIGVWNPDSVNLTGGAAFEGANVTYHNRGSLSQTLGDALAANTTYTLTVQQNLTALNLATAGSWHVELLAADNPLASLSGTIASLTRDVYVLRSVQYTTGSSVAGGQVLGIRLTLTDSAETTTDLVWDDVKLEATAVPEPSSCVLFALMCFGTVATWRWRTWPTRA